MKVTHIYIYGDIVNFQVEDDEMFGCVSLTSVKSQFEKGQDAEELVVHINSCGGDVLEGFAIHDYLVNTGKKVTTIVEGLCASIATVIFLAGSSRLLTENSRFLIHNPWTFAEGNADELAAISEQLRVEQQKMLDFYVKKTGGDAVLLQGLMDEDVLIDADEAVELNFATEIQETVEALARVRNSQHQTLIFNSIKVKSNMKVEQKTKIKATTAKSSTLLGKLKALITGEETVNASSVTLEDDSELFFSGDSLAVGDAVFTDAEMTTPAPDADYKQKDGATIKVVGGLVDSITEAAAAAAETDAEIIARLTSELGAANARANENEQLAVQASASLEALTGEVDQILASGYKPKARVNNNVTLTGKKVVAKKEGDEAEKGELKDAVAEFKAKRAGKGAQA